VARVAQHLGGPPGFDDAPVLQNGDLVREMADDGEVVRDEDEPAPLLLEPGQQLEDLGLHCRVERRGGLVGDHELRIEHRRLGDQRTLAEAAGQFPGALPRTDLGIGDPGVAQGGVHPLLALRLAADTVGTEGLVDLLTHGAQGVEGHERVLQHVADVLAAQATPLPLRQTGGVAAEDVEAVGGHPCIGGIEPHERAGRDGLAGARFTHEGERLAGSEGQ
jgi:hypothetical protein